MVACKKTTIEQRKDGNWKATICFKNSYARKGTSEVFDTKYDAQDWIKGIRKFRDVKPGKVIINKNGWKWKKGVGDTIVGS